VEWLESNNFTLHNIPGILTHFPRAANRNPSIIDLSFSRVAIKDTVENWVHIHESTSDHSVIGLQLTAPQCIVNIRDKICRIRAWAKADWPLFHRSIQLKELNIRDIKSKSVTVMAVKAVPKTKMRSKFAAWWSPNLEWLTTRVKRARKRLIYNTQENTEILDNLKLTWEKSVKNTKDRHWKKKLEEMKSSTVWTTIKRYTLTHTKALPEIEGSSDFQSKCDRLRCSLFQDNPISTLTIPDDFVVSKNDLSNDFTPVSKTEVKKALDSANTKSGVGCDMINYTTLKHLDLANPSLSPNLVTALLQYGIHYYKWNHAICVVVPKQGKSNYTLEKSYRPMFRENN
jgi:hypothetical protein